MPRKRKSPRGNLGAGLSAAELAQLDRWLASRPTSIGSLEALDGYLAAAIAGPSLIMFSELMPRIVGDTDRDPVESLVEVQSRFELVTRHWNAIASGLLSADYRPFLAARDDGRDGETWAAAFLEGVALRKKQWKPFFKGPRESDLHAMLTDLAAGLVNGGQPDGGPLDPEDRSSMVDVFAVIAITARLFFMTGQRAPGATGPSTFSLDQGSDWIAAGAEPPGAEYWEAGWVPIVAGIASEPDTRLVAALIVAGDGRAVRATPVANPPPDAAKMAKLLAHEVEVAMGEVDVRPEAVMVRDQPTATALRRLPALGRVVIEIAQVLPAFDLAAAGLVEHMSGGGATRMATSAPTWMAWGIDSELVSRLFQASAALFRAAPWRHYADDEPLIVTRPSGESWIVVTMGAGKIERGLLCFSDPGDLDGFYSGLPTPGMLRGEMVSISYSPMDDLAPAMRKEVMARGWEVAGHDAFPMAMVFNAPTAGLTPETAERLRETIEVMARYGSTKAPRRGRRWADRETGVVVERG